MTHLRLISSVSVARTDVSDKEVDHPALEAFQREFEFLIRSLRRLGVPRDDVADLAQEVFMILYQVWDKYDPERSLRAYIFGIAFRVSRNHIRKRRREILHAVIDLGDETPRPDAALEANQIRAVVLKALDQIPLARRAVLIMHDIDRLPMDEIATTLSIYRFTGYSRLRKARKELAAAVTSLLGVSEL